MVLVNVGVIPLSIPLLESLVYHLFNISFIAIGLTPSGSSENTKAGGKEIAKASLGMALIQGVAFPLQAISGGLIVMLFGILGHHLFPTLGFLAPLGFEEGPGQALSIGSVWEEFGFEHAATMGLTFATIGFFFAFFVGIPIVNWGVRRGLSTYIPKELPLDFRTGIISKSQKKESAGELTTHSANVDALAFQVALIGLVYTLTYALVRSLAEVLPPDIGMTLWGVFFLGGLIVALMVRWIIEKIGAGHLIDLGLQRRISGWAVDFLIVSTLTAIQLVVVWEYIVPILAISITAGFSTTLAVLYLGSRVWPRYNLERTVVIYGTVTGVVPSGLLLLRVVDPKFQTPAALEVGFMSVFSLPFILAGITLVQGPVLWGWSVGFTIIVLVGVMVLSLALLRALGLWGAPQF